jgi:hypothetical protein
VVPKWDSKNAISQGYERSFRRRLEMRGYADIVSVISLVLLILIFLRVFGII